MKAHTKNALLALAALTGTKAGEAPQVAENSGMAPAEPGRLEPPSLQGMLPILKNCIFGYILSAKISNALILISICNIGLSEKAIRLINDVALHIPTHREAMLEAACRASLYSVTDLLIEMGTSITPRTAFNAAASGNVALLVMLDPGFIRLRNRLG